MTERSFSIFKPRRTALLQYILLAAVAALGVVHVFLGSRTAFRNLAHGTEIAIQPFYNGSAAQMLPLTDAQAHIAGVPRGFVVLTATYVSRPARDAGLHIGDAVYTIDGHPYLGTTDLLNAVARHRPGETVELSFWRAGTAFETPPSRASVALTPQRIAAPALWAWALQIVFTVVPVLCLFTGLYVVAARPRSANAWLILGILGYLAALFLHTDQRGSIFLPVSLAWVVLGQTAMPVCFMLFGVYFPSRSKLDARIPWVKWVLLAIVLALLPVDLMGTFGMAYRYGSIARIYPWLRTIGNVENIASVLAIFYAFACLGGKTEDPDISPDARRRLNVLLVGCSIGLTPLFFLVAYSTYSGRNLGEGTPQWIVLPVLTILCVFPLTLAYVVVVQRAMDVRILLRQGTKYFFARQSVLILGILLAIWMSRNLSIFFSDPGHRRIVDIVRIFGIVALFFVYRTITAKRLQKRIDRMFFREAYSTEQILSELSDEARNFTETTPLLETITQRLASTLHIDRIAVFLRTGDLFQLEFATGVPVSPSYVPALSANSTTITHLVQGKSAPANVYRDDPSSWLVDATDAERAALADLSTELLVPLPGRNRLVGVIALGPKRSEEPYSKADRQLLQSVASQAGLALENAELLENLTVELDRKARAMREAEIAREVQERLFPQVYPSIAGIDLCGFCRPANFVGGDYYDFFLIPQPGEGAVDRLAIAIGDISGKGVSAALLMASLRASLRSVATIQQPPEVENRRLATMMQHVNRLVYEASTSNRYATFFYAELDPATRILTYVNAGHNCPVVLRGAEAIALQPTGTVIGLLPEAVYEQATLELQSGDSLLAFTDGISEAMTADDEEWGEDRMIAAAQHLLSQTSCKRTAHQLLECLLAEADAFTAGAPQHDDMTLLVTILC